MGERKRAVDAGGVRPYALSKAALNPADVVGELSPVGKLVYLAAQMDPDEAAEWADKVFDMRRTAFEGAMSAELARFGCGGEGRLTTGPELKALRDGANQVGAGIANTYNYWLARQIQQIREDVPTANRHVYANRLFYSDGNWAAGYWEQRADMIGATETSEGANRGLEAFYRNNEGFLDYAGAEVVPYPTVCSVCASYVEGNPYKSMEDLYNKCMLPAHPYCPHIGVPTDVKPMSRQQCAELWRGG